MSDFNVNAFCNELSLSPDNEVLKEWKQIYQALSVAVEDAWSARALFWGLTSAAENQLSYLGGNFLPNLERRVNNLEGNGILSETDLQVSFHTNEDQPHINEDQDSADLAAEVKVRIDEINERMQVMAIVYVLGVQHHDDISRDLEQLTFSGIKAKAAANRAAKEAAA
tara:strand:- start:1833 stop:2336 length:504 start_codon:yes stop_codon:yes gene_type:complete